NVMQLCPGFAIDQPGFFRVNVDFLCLAQMVDRHSDRRARLVKVMLCAYQAHDASSSRIDACCCAPPGVTITLGSMPSASAYRSIVAAVTRTPRGLFSVLDTRETQQPSRRASPP